MKIYPNRTGPRLGKIKVLCTSSSPSYKHSSSSFLANAVLNGCESRFMAFILDCLGKISNAFTPNTIKLSAFFSEYSTMTKPTASSWHYSWVEKSKTSSSGPGIDNSMDVLYKISSFCFWTYQTWNMFRFNQLEVNIFCLVFIYPEFSRKRIISPMGPVYT